MGENLSHPSFRFAYEHTVIYFQAGTEGADLKLPGNQKVSLSRGQTHAVHVNAGDKISSSNPVQAFLLTGDVGSTFEMRWYALIDIDKWTNDYYRYAIASKDRNILPHPLTSHLALLVTRGDRQD